MAATGNGALRTSNAAFSYGGVRFRYRAWSVPDDAPPDDTRGKAPIVLVHGFAQSAESWGTVAPALAARTGREVRAIDLVGHGRTDRPADPNAYDFAFQGEALAAFARWSAENAGSVASPVVGYSMGGRVALAALEADADAFSAVVLESAGVGPADDEERAQLKVRNFKWASRVRTEGVEAFMTWWEGLPLFATQRELALDVRDRLRMQRLSNDAEALALSFERAGAHMMPVANDALSLLRARACAGVPVAYVAGARDAKYRAVAAQVGAVLSDIPSGNVAIIEGAGHNAHLERSGAFVRSIAGTLRGVSDMRCPGPIDV